MTPERSLDVGAGRAPARKNGPPPGTHGLESRPVAVRSDRLGRREEVGFAGKGDRVFTSLHLPPFEPLAGVLICSSICSDFMANYQREVELARALAARGIAAQRFHYRGTGNSEGDPAALSFDSLCEDAREMSEVLRGRVAQAPVGLIGTRWGALAAAEVSRGFPGSPLVFWEPTTDAAKYFREAGRARLIRDAREGRSGAARSNDVGAEFESRGFMDLLGYSVYRPLYESAKGRTLPSVMDRRPHPLLIVQMARGKSGAGTYETLVAELAEAGYKAEVEQAELAESWWFHTDAVLRFRPLIERTCEWLERRLTVSNRQGGP
jgi:hypothetical protein